MEQVEISSKSVFQFIFLRQCLKTRSINVCSCPEEVLVLPWQQSPWESKVYRDLAVVFRFWKISCLCVWGSMGFIMTEASLKTCLEISSTSSHLPVSTPQFISALWRRVRQSSHVLDENEVFFPAHKCSETVWIQTHLCLYLFVEKPVRKFFWNLWSCQLSELHYFRLALNKRW